MTMPNLVLACAECGWRPDADMTVEEVDSEHMVGVHHKEPNTMSLDMQVRCPRDDTHMTDPAIFPLGGGRDRHEYVCSKCHRRYTLVANTPEESKA